MHNRSSPILFYSATEIYNYPKIIIYTLLIIPSFVFFGFFIIQLANNSKIDKSNTAKHTILSYYKYLDLQQFDKAYNYIYQSPDYTFDQFLLEKSMKDGGLIPAFAKLDTITLKSLIHTKNEATIVAKIRWNTSMGKRNTIDTLFLRHDHNLWRILPSRGKPAIPINQVDNYKYLLFKKNGKRLISTFPTIYEDRVKKPFLQYRQINLLYEKGFYITGEILNADNFPVSILIRAIVVLRNGKSLTYFTDKTIHYNLSPKAHTYFRIDIDSRTNPLLIDDIQYIKIDTQSDISERGYFPGPPIELKYVKNDLRKTYLDILFHNDQVNDISIPGLLVAHFNNEGYIVDTELVIFDNSIQSGISQKFSLAFPKSEKSPTIIHCIPFQYFINDQERTIINNTSQDTLSAIKKFDFLPHCFMAKEIYLQ